jgi:hypothetical protein
MKLGTPLAGFLNSDSNNRWADSIAEQTDQRKAQVVRAPSSGPTMTA